MLIVAGGTGGHISPGAALGTAFAAADYRVLYLTLEKNREYPDFKNSTFPVFTYAAPRPGPGPFDLVRFPFRAARAVAQAMHVMRENNVNAVVAMGGFPCVPAIIGAAWLRLPLFLCEQNAVPGRATNFGALFARRVFLNLPVMRGRVRGGTIVGNPVRPIAVAVRPGASTPFSDLPSGKTKILVLGGSQGAQQLNTMSAGSVPNVNDSVWVIQCGRGNKEALEGAMSPDVRDRVRVVEFVEDMASLYAAADILVCRAGAGVLSEALVHGIPMILVPYPFATDNHQLENARVLEGGGAAIVINTKSSESAPLVTELSSLIPDTEKRRRMGQRARDLARPRAASEIVSHIGVELNELGIRR